MSAGFLEIGAMVLIAILTLCLIYSVRLNIKLGVIILNVEDSIEESLDILDQRYESISKILEIPIFFDSVEVRQVVSDIDMSRDAILKVANVISSAPVEDPNG